MALGVHRMLHLAFGPYVHGTGFCEHHGIIKEVVPVVVAG